VAAFFPLVALAARIFLEADEPLFEDLVIRLLIALLVFRMNQLLA
jgi:hypothetical protein